MLLSLTTSDSESGPQSLSVPEARAVDGAWDKGYGVRNRALAEEAWGWRGEVGGVLLAGGACAFSLFFAWVSSSIPRGGERLRARGTADGIP